MTSKTPPADVLVGAYRKIRAAMDKVEEQYKQDITGLKEQLEVVSASLLNICNEQNVDSLRTPMGTVTRRSVTRYWTSDWERMYEFIQANDAMQLLEQRIHNGNMRQFLEENPEVLPVGLNADTKYAVTVRKPTNK